MKRLLSLVCFCFVSVAFAIEQGDIANPIKIEHGTLRLRAFQSRYAYPTYTNVVDLYYNRWFNSHHEHGIATEIVDGVATKFNLNSKVNVKTDRSRFVFFTQGCANSTQQKTSHNFAPALFFTPTEPGRFILEGNIVAASDQREASTADLKLTVIVGIYDGSGTFRNILKKGITPFGSLNLTEILTEKRIAIDAGEQLVIAAYRNAYHHWSSITLSQLNIYPAPIETTWVIR